MPGVEFAAAGDRLELRPSRAAWHAASRSLLVADLHVGKAVSFRRLGVPVPEATTEGTLRRLSDEVQALQARQVVVLGDFLHGPLAHGPAPGEALRRWRDHHAGLSLVLVRGNHDARAGDPDPALGLEVVDEPWALGAWQLAHHPRRGEADAPVVCGHLHPCTRVGQGARRLRLACFHWRDACLVMPAFGEFTGMHPVDRTPGDRLFVVGEGAVHEWPAAPAYTARR